MGNMRFKVGDRVRIKSLDWYKETMDDYGRINYGFAQFIPDMSAYCGKILTICNIKEDFSYYHMKECQYVFMDEMIEGLVEEETKSKYEDEVTGEYYSTPKYLVRPNGYQFVDENGNVINARKIVLEKKKKEYPKTYEECCKVLQYNENLKVYPPFNADIPEYDFLGLFNSLETLRKLLVCRDAYWKIVGEEMGLGKPWEPDWDDDEWPDMYYISWSGKYLEKEKGYPCCNMILIFPTEEMRDAFYENFKELIEQCKELL